MCIGSGAEKERALVTAVRSYLRFTSVTSSISSEVEIHLALYIIHFVRI